jgi:hypothetical protein
MSVKAEMSWGPAIAAMTELRNAYFRHVSGAEPGAPSYRLFDQALEFLREEGEKALKQRAERPHFQVWTITTKGSLDHRAPGTIHLGVSAEVTTEEEVKKRWGDFLVTPGSLRATLGRAHSAKLWENVYSNKEGVL